MAALCCDYKTARRGMLVTNMIIMLFSLVFIGVGSTSLSYGQSFAEVLGDYCIQKCAETSLLEQPDPVGCDCKPEPGHTTLPTVVFITPAIGLIVIGVFTFVSGLIGCVGAIRERQRLLYMYSCALFIVILLQFGFGGAAAAVAAGNAPEIQGPLYGAIKQNYKSFDWANLHVFFPPACYEGKTLNPKPNVTTPLYQYPLCAFDGKCVNDGSPDEQRCCKDGGTQCDQSQTQCMTGDTCLETFFGRAAAPVATMCFLPIALELLSITFACVVAFKTPEFGIVAGAPVATMCFLPIVVEFIAICFACVIAWKRPPPKDADFA